MKMLNEFGMIGSLRDFFKLNQPSMYEVGRYFSTHKAAVRRIKNKKNKKR